MSTRSIPSTLLGVVLAALLTGSQARADQDLCNTPQGFYQCFTDSLEFIDYPDVLVAIAFNNARTWERYDDDELHWGCKTATNTGCQTRLMLRWDAAKAATLSGTVDSQLMQIHDIFMEQHNGDLLKANLEDMSEDDWEKIPFRGTPIDDAGGDIDDAGDGHGGYDRLSLAQYAAMQQNPLLILDAKPDPSSPQSMLLRYRYPSAGTWEHFAARLSPALQAKLAAAKAAGKLDYRIGDTGGIRTKPEYKTFRALNKQIIAELLRQAYQSGAGPDFTPAANYQRMISVHPFDDYNGRSLRAWYRREAGKPMFMWNFYNDLYSSEAAFAALVAEGDAQYTLLISAMQGELAAHPSNPDNFSLPQFWMLPAEMTTLPTNASQFVADSKAWFSHCEGQGTSYVCPIADRIKHKLFDGVEADFQAHVQGKSKE